MQKPELYMQRCLQLAELGRGWVAPNPMVGAVLVYDERIIGEGYHQQFGQAHAEVNCINSVAEADKHLITHSTIYVSLEPCAHFGKTPPCADLILAHNIPKVVIGCTDPFEKVAGKGIDKLKQAGIQVELDILKDECLALNKRFFTFHKQKRPYIILKWAQSSNHAIGTKDGSRVLISNEITNRLVHQWRHEEAGILVGTRTALLDNPALDVRLTAGKNPTRLVIDLEDKLPEDLKLFDQMQPTIVFNYHKSGSDGLVNWIKIDRDKNRVEEILAASYQLNIQSILVEGGTKTLQSFIDHNLWDEARIITNENLVIANGYPAPILKAGVVKDKKLILTDSIIFYRNPKAQ